jgi:phosphatidylglycerophosphatase C
LKKIAFFDFDGTITTKDTLLEFIKFSKGPLAFYAGFLMNIPYLMAWKLGIINNQKAKERMLTHFFRGTELNRFQEDCNRFASGRLTGLLRPKAIQEIAHLKKAGVEVVIVSASPENWIRPWTDGQHLQLLATRLQILDNRLTGNIYEYNCHGEEKVRRIKEVYRLEEYTEIYAFGDTKGDLPMLSIATKPSYKPFR